MEKPWDKLRKPVVAPINPGIWKTCCQGEPMACVELVRFKQDSGRPQIAIATQIFGPNGLRQLAEFCTELADQLESQ